MEGPTENMSQGISFYCQHTGPIVPLIGALHSLVKYWDGSIHVVLGDRTPRVFCDSLKGWNRCTTQQINTWDLFNPKSIRRKVVCFLTKIYLHQILPFNVNLVYDCDVVFANKVPHSIFTTIEQQELVNFYFSHEELPLKPQRKAYLKTRLLHSLGYPKRFYSSVNGGCVGSLRSSTLLQEWAENSDRILHGDANYLAKVPDEPGLSVTLANHGLLVGGSEICYRLWRNGDEKKTSNSLGQSIVAYHLTHHFVESSRRLRAELNEAYRENFLGFRKHMGFYERWSSHLCSYNSRSRMRQKKVAKLNRNAVREVRRWRQRVA